MWKFSWYILLYFKTAFSRLLETKVLTSFRRFFSLDSLVTQVIPFYMLDWFFFSHLVWFMFKQGLTVSSRLTWNPWSSGLVYHEVCHDCIFLLTVSFPLSPNHFLWAHGWLIILWFDFSCLSCHYQDEICSGWSDLILQWEGRRRKSRSQFQVTFLARRRSA